MHKVFDLLRTAAPTDVNVLILGENGTGKELVASAIHDLSPRRDAPYVKVNCAAIPGELLESELFGARKGAFTGATADRKGLFESAHRGSILLDEIGEMPAALQVKLLRVLQEREFTPVGATAPIRADFRLICSTNVDPTAAVEEHRLRQDLYFRLNTFVLSLPPLRDRREDISLLVDHFLGSFTARYERECKVVQPAAMEALQRYDWRGNVRELEHAIERAVILARGDSIGVHDLPDAVRRGTPAPRTGRVVLPAGYTLDELERLAIQQTLERTGWNKRATAESLGIHRPTLYNKMRKHGLWKAGDRFRRLLDEDGIPAGDHGPDTEHDRMSSGDDW
jgi:transcriptional regulator with PAS, ATPase and Fis domain